VKNRIRLDLFIVESF